MEAANGVGGGGVFNAENLQVSFGRESVYKVMIAALKRNMGGTETVTLYRSLSFGIPLCVCERERESESECVCLSLSLCQRSRSETSAQPRTLHRNTVPTSFQKKSRREENV